MKRMTSFGGLIACLERQARRFYDTALAAHGLGAGTHRIVARLFRHGGMNQNELSQKLVLDKASITRAVRRLLAAGYVTRKRDRNDRRANRIFLSAKGMRVMSTIHEARGRWMQILSRGFSKQEQDSAVRLMQRMYDNSVEWKLNHESQQNHRR